MEIESTLFNAALDKCMRQRVMDLIV